MNILLFTPVAPNPKSSGSLMLYQMIKATEKHHFFFCFSVNDFFKPIRVAEDLQIPHKNVYRPFDRAIFNKFEPVSNFIENLKSVYIKNIIVPATIKFGKKHDVEYVWAVLQDKATITSAKVIAEKLGVPLITQVWDSPKWMITANNIDKKTKKCVLGHFDKAIASSQSCAVASWKMAEVYSKKYGVNTAVIVGSIDRKNIIKQPSNNNNKIIVGLAGQIYARKEWQSLINALERVNWEINGKKIEINLIGGFDNTVIFPNKRVKMLGRHNQKKTIDLLSKMNIGYCPYWFDKQYKEVATTSFPSKLATYYAAGIPVLFHGPKYSSPASFITKNQSGVICSSLYEKDIIKDIKYIINNETIIVKRQLLAFNKYLTSDIFKQETTRFLSDCRPQKKKVLIVGFADSIHTKRWIEQINKNTLSTMLLPSVVTLFSGNNSEIKIISITHKKYRYTISNRIINYALYRFSPIINKYHLRKVIKLEKPDVVHSLEFQHAGYLVNNVRKSWKGKFPKWIATNWGSDIYYFGRLAKHKKRIKAVLENCDFYSCECKRDVCLAKEYGLEHHKVLPIFPNAGGFDLKKLEAIRNKRITSSRKIIMLKGYQNWAGRALTALKALERCAPYLEGYTIAVYSIQPRSGVTRAVNNFTKKTGIKTKIIPLGTSHEEMLKMHSRARVSIGISISDAISTSLLEAIVMGAFPIQSNTSCADEWIQNGKSGYIIPPDNTSNIAGAIKNALTDDKLVDRASRINWQVAKRKLDQDKIKEQINHYYEHVLKYGRK